MCQTKCLVADVFYMIVYFMEPHSLIIIIIIIIIIVIVIVIVIIIIIMIIIINNNNDNNNINNNDFVNSISTRWLFIGWYLKLITSKINLEKARLKCLIIDIYNEKKKKEQL